jgi:two-component system chemotaxis response regulator CheV
MPELTRLPDLAKGVLGILNLRGTVIPAFDLGHLLYGAEASVQGNRMIVAEFNKIRIGLIVSSVNRIHRISWEHVKPPSMIHQIDPSSLTVIGIVNMDDKTILMIDVEKIIAEINSELALKSTTHDSDQFGQSFTVLTAEDSSVIRALIVRELKKAGFNIVSKNDGLSAWNHLLGILPHLQQGESLHDHIHLVITDIEMPQMDGYTLTKNIKSNDNFRELPVMIFSSMITDDNRHKGESVGADVQLTKPEIDRLLECARELLEV